MELADGTTLTRLLEELKLKPELVVVELNLNILKREELAQTQLQSGDQVEIVHFVGGGSSLRGFQGCEGTLQARRPGCASCS